VMFQPKHVTDPYEEAKARLTPKVTLASLINQSFLGPNLSLARSPQSASGSSQGLPTVPRADVSGASTSSAAGGAAGDFEKFINSIAKQESGGRYEAVNKSSGALGKYQIMPANIASWSKAALGKSITPSQFLKSPQLQEAVARKKLKEYYNRYGAGNAAKAWYGGPGAVKKSGNKSQGAYPTINNYSAAITRRMGK
jgi:hypothetical protein